MDYMMPYHYEDAASWIANKWFWAGLFGNLPALVAFLGHVLLSRNEQD
jgi:hypothetical protein